MNIDSARHPELFAGMSSLECVPDGVVPSRFRAGTIWSDSPFMTGCPAGVRLRFRTTSRYLRMKVFLGENRFAFEHGYFSVIINGAEPLLWDPPAPYETGQCCEWSLALPEAENEIEIWLPSYRKVTIQSLEVSDNAEILPLPSRPRTLFLGDSITQGYAAYPAYSWAAQLSRMRSRDLLNLGIGGAQMPSALPAAILEESFDEVFLAFGANDANRARKAEDFEAAAEATLAFLRKKPGVRMIVLSPIHLPNLEHTEKAVYLRQYPEILKRLAERYRAMFIHGSDLVPHNPLLFFDGCHPTNEGMRLYAENLRKKLQF